MSDLLSTVQTACQQALVAVRAFSTRAPGSPTTQALAAGALIGFLTYTVMKKRYRLPPGPFAWPLLGNLLSLRNKKEQLYVTLLRWAKEKYGPVITIYFGPIRCVTLNNIEVVTEALVEKGDDYAGRPFLHSLDVISEGSKNIAFVSASPAWKLHRKIAMQALRHYMRGSHLEKVVHQVMAMITDKMAAEPGAFDPHLYTTSLMFHIIDTICFGECKPLGDPSINKIMQGFDTFNKVFGNGFLEDIIPFLKYCPTKKFRTANVFFEDFIIYIYKHTHEHRKTFNPDNIRDLTDSILLAQSETEDEESAEVMAMFTDAHVRHTLGDIFGAGADTSRLTLEWALLFMAGNHEIQQRAQAEIDAATGTGMPGVGHRARLQYTEAVLYEVMRLGTILPTALPHCTLCDTSVGGYDVPKGTMVLINQWAVMHDPDKWDQPEEFKPERFLDEQGKLKTKLESWTPFSLGRRACLGESVAKPELVLILACLLKRFTISLPEGAVFNPGYEEGSITFHPPKSYKIVVTPR